MPPVVEDDDAARPHAAPEVLPFVLRALLAKHGDFGLTAMARDMKVNTLQHTEAHLRRRIAKMKVTLTLTRT